VNIIKTSDVEAKSRFAGIFNKPLLGADTGSGAVTVSELTMKPGAVLPSHTHIVEEAFFVVEGSGEAVAGEETSPVAGGSALLAPAGVPHGFRNTGDQDLRIICMYPAINPTAKF
jgi:mannose-6-phosphate isomerase-like protein (cupin superfamily)